MNSTTSEGVCTSPTSPGTPSPPTRRSPRRIPAGSSTSRSAPRSTPCPPWCAPRSPARPRTTPATRPRTARPTLREAVAGVAGAPVRGRPSTRSRCCRRSAPRSWSPGCPRCSGSAAGDTVVIPELAYPTYEVGALLAGAEFVRTDSTAALGPRRVGAGLAQLAVQPDRPGAAGRAPAQGRRRGRASAGAVVASDECYLSLSAAAAPRRVGAASRRLRRLARGPARGALDVASRPTSPATGPGSWPATRRWSRRCWRCASTPG